MKKYLKLIIPAALLLITVNAFSNDNIEKIKKEINNQQLNELKQEINNFIAKENPQPIMDSTCNGNTYCLKHFELLMEAKVPVERITQLLQNKTNHKQFLYNSKYVFAFGYGLNIILSRVETREIEKLSSCKELKAYITDMPITKMALIPFAAKYLEKCNIDSGYKDPIINFMDSEIFCEPELDMAQYNINNLCSLFPPEKDRYGYNVPVMRTIIGDEAQALDNKENYTEEEMESIEKDVQTIESIRKSKGVPCKPIQKIKEYKGILLKDKDIQKPSEMEDSIEEDINQELPV